MLSESAVLQAIARGWCHPENSGKEVDVALSKAIAKEIMAINEAAVLEEQAKAEPTGHIVVSTISEKYHEVDYDFPRETLKTLGFGRHALYLHPSPAPEGMVLVPSEPTEAMLDAAAQVSLMTVGWVTLKYQAMIAAAEKESGKCLN